MKIGSAWIKEDKNGGKYLSCVVNIPFVGDMSFAMFKEKEKKNDNSPDYSIIWNNKKEQSKQSNNDDSIPFG